MSINDKDIFCYSTIKENLVASSCNSSKIVSKYEIPVAYASKYKLELTDKSEKINLVSDISKLEDDTIILKELHEKNQARKNSKKI